MNTTVYSYFVSGAANRPGWVARAFFACRTWLHWDVFGCNNEQRSTASISNPRSMLCECECSRDLYDFCIGRWYSNSVSGVRATYTACMTFSHVFHTFKISCMMAADGFKEAPYVLYCNRSRYYSEHIAVCNANYCTLCSFETQVISSLLEQNKPDRCGSAKANGVSGHCLHALTVDSDRCWY